MTAPASDNVARRAFDVVAAAQSADTLAQLEATAGAELHRYGFGVVIAVEITRRRGAQAITPIFGDISAPSILHYIERRHYAHCPVIRAASSAPTVWRDLKAQALDSAQRQVFDELGEFSMHDGHIITVRLGDNLPIGVSLAGPAVALDCPFDRTAVHLLSTHYGLIGAKFTQPRWSGGCLSPRQLECLRWVRDGKSSFDIGEILGISARTVDQHLLTACTRLGVRTRVQAVVEASLCGFLSL
jgi:DNA-binding CsgD family transcriptional regulator